MRIDYRNCLIDGRPAPVKKIDGCQITQMPGANIYLPGQDTPDSGKYCLVDDVTGEWERYLLTEDGQVKFFKDVNGIKTETGCSPGLRIEITCQKADQPVECS